MPVPSSINDLSTVAGDNSPGTGETPKDGDDYLRQHASYIASLRDKLNGTADTGTIKNPTLSGTVAGNPTLSGTAYTWSGNPTHGGNHTFSGNIDVVDLTADTVSAGNLLAGTYTPTFTNQSNVTASSVLGSVWRYIRVGNMVTVGGALNLTTGASTGSAELYATLPIASNLASNYDLTGVCTHAMSPSDSSWAVLGLATSDVARLTGTNVIATTTHSLFVSFMYEIKT